MSDTFWTLKLGDILTILAVGLSPLIAVLLQKWFESKGATLNQRRWIFKTLMTTRTAPLDLNHVQALNMIALEFRDRKYEALRQLVNNHAESRIEPDLSSAHRETDTGFPAFPLVKPTSSTGEFEKCGLVYLQRLLWGRDVSQCLQPGSRPRLALVLLCGSML